MQESMEDNAHNASRIQAADYLLLLCACIHCNAPIDSKIVCASTLTDNVNILLCSRTREYII